MPSERKQGFLLLLVALLLAGCTQPGLELTGDTNSGMQLQGGTRMLQQVAQTGDAVKVAYIGKFEDGNIFDRSAEGQFLAFAIGSGQVITGFDEGVKGMKIGETRTITIPAKDAYGDVREDQILRLPIERFGDSAKALKIGATINASNGAEGKVIDVNADTATVDFNHPLAGKTLIFEITLKEIVQ